MLRRAGLHEEALARAERALAVATNPADQLLLEQRIAQLCDQN